MDNDNVKAACRQLMQTADLVFVSTIDENGFPQTRAMSNLYNFNQFPMLSDFFDKLKNDFIVYLCTNRESIKMHQVKENPRVCLYYCRFPATHGLALSGNIEIIEDPLIRQTLWQDEWTKVYKDGLIGDDYTVLRVKPFSARGWFKDGKYEFSIP